MAPFCECYAFSRWQLWNTVEGSIESCTNICQSWFPSVIRKLFRRRENQEEDRKAHKQKLEEQYANRINLAISPCELECSVHYHHPLFMGHKKPPFKESKMAMSTLVNKVNALQERVRGNNKRRRVSV